MTSAAREEWAMRFENTKNRQATTEAGSRKAWRYKDRNTDKLEEAEDKVVIRKPWPIFHFHRREVRGPNHYRPHKGDWGTYTCI